MKRILTFILAMVLAISLVACSNAMNIFEVEPIEKNEYDSNDSDYETVGGLTNENASPNAKRLYNFLTDCYGSYVISGQTGGEKEFQAVYGYTGKLPAIACFDMMAYSPSRKSQSDEVEKMLKWSEQGGIIELAWHWYAPEPYYDPNNPQNKGGFRQAAVTEDFDLTAFVNDPDSDGYKALIADIDAISEQLKILAEKDIPILWRPLHEAGGMWGDNSFWWSYYGGDTYVKLYRIMYDRMVNHNKLNNLIWISNLDNEKASEFYPGNEYCDILSCDYYQSYTGGKPLLSQEWFEQIKALANGKKIVALTENDTIPDIDEMFKTNQRYLWFAPWNGEFTVNEDGTLNETYNTLESWMKIYNHERVLTLDELPDLTKYRLD